MFQRSLPPASRPSIQQSSRLTYWYPTTCMPLETIVSAICSMSVSFMLHWKVFHEFHPIGGVAPTGTPDPASALPPPLPPEPASALLPPRPPEPTLPPPPPTPPVPVVPPEPPAPPLP